MGPEFISTPKCEALHRCRKTSKKNIAFSWSLICAFMHAIFHFHSIQTQHTGITPKMTSTGIEDQIYFVSLVDHLGLIYIMRHKDWIYILYTI